MPDIKHNIKFKKLLYYFSNKNYVEVLNVINDSKTEILSMNDNITTLMMDSLECICLFELDYKDTFMIEINDVLKVDDSIFRQLPDSQKELVAITLLMAACYLIFDNINDVNQLPSDVVNECKKIQNELEVINSNSETVKIISTAMLLAIQKINKKNMVSDVEVIKKCFTDYMDILYNKMYEYSYSN